MLNILIVEDEEIERTVLKMIILDNIDEIQTVREAKNGYEAVKIIDSAKIDLAFVDINIPGIGGLDVIKYLKIIHPDCGVIIVTAYDKFEIAHTAIKLRVDDYLLKPVRPTALVEIIKTYIKEKHNNEITDGYNAYVSELKEKIIENIYYDATQVLKVYIDEIYVSADHNMIRKSLELFGKEIIGIGKDMQIKTMGKLQNRLEQILASNLYKKGKYKVYSGFKELISVIFLDLDNKKENSDKNIKSIINYIEINIKNAITLDDVANYSNRNVYYLSKLFKKEMGINFMDYLTYRRIDIAKEMLLDTDMPMKNISIELSYNEPNYFSRTFKKNVGVTPSEYRDRGKKEEEKKSIRVCT